MDLRKILEALKLEKEVIDNIIEKIGGEKVMVDDDNFLPLKEVKKKLQRKDDEINDLEEEIKNRDKQLKGLKKSLKDVEELEDKLNNALEENKLQKEKYEKEKEEREFNIGLEKRLIKDYKAKNVKAVKALLDLEKVKKDGDDYLGLKEQMDKITETDDYLFGKEENPKLKGKEVNLEKDGNKQSLADNPFKSKTINLTKQAQLLNENPDLAKTMIKAAGLDPRDYNL